MIEKPFSGKIIFGKICTIIDKKIEFNFEISYSKLNYLGGYALEYDNEMALDKIEFFNNEIKKTYNKLNETVKVSFKNKIYKHLEIVVPEIWSRVCERLCRRVSIQELIPQVLDCEKDKKNNLDYSRDLDQIFNGLNMKYFNGEVRAAIEWSKNSPDRKRSSILLGSYSDELKLIRISPFLKKTFVPQFFIESVIYHEMLHVVHRTKRFNGRNKIHTHHFREDEKKFEFYSESKSWLKENLSKLLS